MEYQDLILDRFQEEAVQEIETGQSIIISAPTGAGKTLVAEYAIEKSLREGKEAIYTAPIKALSNQKYRDFTQRYGDKVGIMTGDLTLNGDAPILIMTTEIFRNALFENPHRFDNVLYLIFDEIHYIDNVERGSVWEESLIFAPPTIQVVCLSATIPNVEELAEWIGKIRNSSVKVIYEENRPVPLYEYCLLETKGIISLDEARRSLSRKRRKQSEVMVADPEVVHGVLEHLAEKKQMPCLYFVFSRKECESYARQVSDVALLNPNEQKQVVAKLKEFSKKYGTKCSPNQGFGALLLRGIAYHHAGMLPSYKELVEQLFTDGLIKALFATETFALGVNMPATSVVFSRLKKYDGISVRYLKPLEYQQMSGRAGRRGMDQMGYVYANLYDHAINRKELERILTGPADSISSQFNLSYSSLINLYGRAGRGVIKTCDKSFLAFQRMKEAQRTGGKKQRQKIMSRQRMLIKNKLAFLQTLGYINSETLTSKGRFACRINGYELQITEIFFEGILENLNEVDLFVALVAIIFEGKKSDRYARVPKHCRKLVRRLDQRVTALKKMEAMFSLDEIKEPDFRLSAASFAWAHGESFSGLEEFCRASPGDIIRNFRLAVQLCRQLRKCCEDYDEFVQLVDRCLLVVNRDEVNALKQLKAFSALGK